MPALAQRLTDTVAKKAIPPTNGYALYWCRDTPGFGLRVTSAGARAWVMERRVDGKTVRRTLGKAEGRSGISAEAARKLMITRSSELQQGRDEMKERRERTKAAEKDITLGEAIRQYVKKQRAVGEETKHLKARTIEQYLGSIAPPREYKRQPGVVTLGGSLYPLASKPLSAITGDMIRALHAKVERDRGERQVVKTMQVLRATLNWNGVDVPRSPFSKTTPGRERISTPQAVRKPNPIPSDELGRWWLAASAASDREHPWRAGWRAQSTADFLRFIVLTGVRSGESAGSDYVHGARVADVDFQRGILTLPDTKNRRDHILYLSTQAMEIVKNACAGKKPGDLVFDVRDAQRALNRICEAAEVPRRTPHALRKTFASLAERLVSWFTMKAMLNHLGHGDVTHTHYLARSSQELREGWQKIADHVEQLARDHIDEKLAPARKAKFEEMAARMEALNGETVGEVVDIEDLL